MKNKYKNPYGIYHDICPYNLKNDLDYPNYKSKQYNYQKHNYEYPMMYIPVQLPVEDMNGMDEMDLHHMKRMYPDICRKIQYWIDEECDKMEYNGSYMYDEYPDKEIIEMITDRIHEKAEKEENLYDDNTMEVDNIEKAVDIKATYKPRGKRGNRWLRNLIKIILLNEMFGRRRNYRRRCKKNRYYPNYNYDYYQKPYQKPHQKRYSYDYMDYFG